MRKLARTEKDQRKTRKRQTDRDRSRVQKALPCDSSPLQHLAIIASSQHNDNGPRNQFSRANFPRARNTRGTDGMTFFITTQRQFPFFLFSLIASRQHEQPCKFTITLTNYTYQSPENGRVHKNVATKPSGKTKIIR